MSWRVIDASELDGRIGYRRGQLLITPTDGEPVGIPLAEVQMVLAGLHCSISGGIMLKLGELGIPILFTDWRKLPQSAAQGWPTHTRVGARQIAQSNLSLPRRKNAWGQLIKAKVQNQGKALSNVGNSAAAEHLKELSRQVRSGDPTNIEGQAARYYWRNLRLNSEFTRQQESGDPFNGALNYGYTILRGLGIRAAFSAGLWPALGVAHHGRSNMFNLVDDLIEPFRPVVDLIVHSLGHTFTLDDPSVKKALASVAQQQFTMDGAAVDTSLNSLAKSFGLYVEGDLDKLMVPQWIGSLPDA
ncbi:type II CRISPR-associated endonuclease Cas1 [Corynebacterium sp. 320]|uniref:type II CRISPR-associated endonuclease Cas1 n=1 Tax=Corynebacterium TaxID=1716 RepID=UPI00125CAEF1|nr:MULTISPECIES: type II CRISPR-associated endonuclease Cas1 [Corynebacterium]KAB1503048.1 type II CRISPR-associated endonuclease Cas1 [Corynebacterium sp. 320]KAB1551100.1 type II CRISPR-associated endonuclease Cas1 [Corynebacterium sp. 319]KAB3526845.1 type II CRISPR-associated endonuclease Cas1 [Corynebacterium sp. 250]KAB3538338.1 type II CRISPR-associated endonuclease Cas1 [Corynebacterium sp. 366]QNP92542.1 type II CRISPR-associated endonuclease Cas1 [Corynebacterium zhongnanshanii]